MQITFINAAQSFILEAFNKTRDSENFLVEKLNPRQRVLSQDGEEINLDHFAGVKKGSQIFIKSDLISLMRLCDDLA